MTFTYTVSVEVEEEEIQEMVELTLRGFKANKAVNMVIRKWDDEFYYVEDYIHNELVAEVQRRVNEVRGE